MPESTPRLPSGREFRRRWRALDWRTRERLGRLSGTGRWPSTLEEARLIAARSRRFRRYLVPSVTLRASVIAGASTFALGSGHLLVLVLPALLVPDVIVSSIGLPRVIREDRINRRVVLEMEDAAGSERR
jgi:hypothetical protein